MACDYVSSPVDHVYTSGIFTYHHPPGATLLVTVQDNDRDSNPTGAGTFLVAQIVCATGTPIFSSGHSNVGVSSINTVVSETQLVDYEGAALLVMATGTGVTSTSFTVNAPYNGPYVAQHGFTILASVVSMTPWH